MANVIELCVLVFGATLLIPITHCRGQICLPKEHAPLFIFGDSLFDAGNNNYINTTFRANFYPYGKTTFKYPTGRFSDGRIIPDFIAEYAKLPFIPPYLHPGYHRHIDGANFASAGAGVLSETHQGLAIDLNTQLSYFKNMVRVWRENFGDSEAKRLLGRAVYLLSIGSNDYAVPFTSNSTVLRCNTKEKYVAMVNRNLSTFIKEIYKTGGRKFGFQTLWPFGCLPMTRAKADCGACIDEITELAKLHNKRLPKVLQKLERHLNGFRYSLTDAYTASSERINRPSRYGFKKGKTACCGTGPYRGTMSCGGKGPVKEYELCEKVGEYLFFDSAHPSEGANKQFAELMWSGTPNITGPYNLKALFAL